MSEGTTSFDRNGQHSELNHNNLSTHETGSLSPELFHEASALSSQQFSHLFPAHLYLNRQAELNR